MAQDGTYFVGKAAILQWINTTLSLNLTKIEQVKACHNINAHYACRMMPMSSMNDCNPQTCSGAVACQLLDALHPGTINMSKVQRWSFLAMPGSCCDMTHTPALRRWTMQRRRSTTW